MVAGLEFSVENHLVQGVAIDRQFERLAHSLVLPERRLRPFAVVEVERETHIAEPGDRRQLEPTILAHRVEVGRGDALDQVELARLQIGETHGRVGDRQEDNAVEMYRVLVPIIGEAIEHDAILRYPLGEFVGAGAHRMLAELVARRLSRLGRNDHPGTVGQLRQQRGERLVEHQLYRVVVDDLDRFERADLALAVRARQGEVALETKLHRLGVQRLAIVKLDALTQLHRHGLVVVAEFPLRRQHRHDAELGVDIDELVAERSEDDAADIGARQGRVEDVGVLGKADPQRCLRRGTD